MMKGTEHVDCRVDTLLRPRYVIGRLETIQKTAPRRFDLSAEVAVTKVKLPETLIRSLPIE